MKLLWATGEESRKTARFRNWEAARNSPRFAVFNDGRQLVDADWGDMACQQYHVGFDPPGAAGQTVARKDVISTVRLYLDAQRLRGRLKTMAMMIVRPAR
jgi:hypothetical protein